MGIAHWDEAQKRRNERGQMAATWSWGTREPNDICWYPRSKKLFWRGVGVIGRIETLDYWEGEELE